MGHPHELLRAVARGEMVSGSQVTAELADSAIEHRMAALLLRATEGDRTGSGGVIASLVAFDLAVSSRRQQQDRVLRRVHDRLRDAGVTHTFVKGPVSAIRWFDKPCDRPYSDIDVVVPKGSALAAAVAALDPAHPAVSLLSSNGHEEFLNSVDVVVEGVRVDLQTDALRSGLVPNEYEDWSIGRAELGSHDLRVFDNEHDLIIFVLHQGRDRFRFLLGAAEARRRLEADIDWSKVEALARMEGVWEQVAVGLEVMCDELELAVPVEVPDNWRSALWRKLWEPDVRFLGEVGRIRHIFRGKWLMPLTTKGRTLEAIRFMLSSLFPPEPVLRLHYPRATGPYLWRVLSLRARVIGRRRIWVWRRGDRDRWKDSSGTVAGDKATGATHNVPRRDT